MPYVQYDDKSQKTSFANAIYHGCYAKVPYQATLSASLRSELKHVPVTSDGNCFDATFLKSVMIETDIQKLGKDA